MDFSKMSPAQAARELALRWPAGPPEQLIRDAIHHYSNAALYDRRAHPAPEPKRDQLGIVGLVSEFRSVMKLPVGSGPMANLDQHGRLIAEEVAELLMCLGERDVIGIADAVVDTMYLLVGLAIDAGFADELGNLLVEVHAANMRKLWDDGKPRILDTGKLLKPPGWNGPDLAGILKQQIAKWEQHERGNQSVGWRDCQR